MVYLKMLLIMAVIYYVFGYWSLVKKSQYPYSEYAAQRNKYTQTVLTCIPMFLVYTLQYAVHTDYNNYEKLFNQIKAGEDKTTEVIPLLVNKFLASRDMDFQWVYVILYSVAFFFLIKCIVDYSKDKFLSLILFICVFFVLGFVQLRQLCAVLVCLFAYRYIKTNEFFKYLFFIILAALFHKSAIIMIPMYFLLKKSFSASFYICLGAILSLFNAVQYNLTNWVVRNFLPSYLGRHEMFRNTVMNKWDTIFLCFMILYVLIYYQRMLNKRDINQIFFNGFWVYVLMFFFCRWLPEFDRFGYYFFLPMCILIPNMLECEEHISQRRFLKLLLFFLCIGLFLERNKVLMDYTSIFSRY